MRSTTSVRHRRPAPPHVARAVVVGLDHVNGLQVARILAERGVPVIGIAVNPMHPCARTRFPERVLQTAPGTEALLTTLESLGRELATPAVLFPSSDRYVRAISDHRERLVGSFHVMLPDRDTVHLLMDKSRFYAFAAEHGYPIPATALIHERADAVEAVERLRFPCVLKPANSATPAWSANARRKAFFVRDADGLLDLVERHGRHTDVLIAQEWIEGPGSNLYSCNAYFGQGGEPLATFVARKLRQWPPETGDSCLGEEVRNDDVLDVTTRLFKDLGYRGLAYLEMKRDERTGAHLIVEPNVGRPTGRSAIAEAGGVDLHYAMYADALGLKPRVAPQRYGSARWIYFRRDIQSAIWHARRGELGVSDYLRSLRGPRRDALFTWRDPGPFAWDLARSFGKLVTGRGSVRPA